MNQLLRQQDTSCLRDRDRGRTEMLSKQPAELSLSDAQAPGQTIDTSVVECACVDQRQRPRYRADGPRQQTLARFPADSAGTGGSQLPAPLLPSRRTSCFPVSASVLGRSAGNRPALS
jgi:hypothetical protein